LPIRQAAVYAGLSRTTLLRLVEAGRLKVYNPTPRKRLIDRQELDRLVLASAE
jgi:excisionase family DNA binding protein